MLFFFAHGADVNARFPPKNEFVLFCKLFFSPSLLLNPFLLLFLLFVDRSALHYAVKHKRLVASTFLLLNNADPNLFVSKIKIIIILIVSVITIYVSHFQARM